MFRVLRFILSQASWAIRFYRFSRWFYERGRLDCAETIWLFSRWITNIDIYPSAVIGKELRIYHPMGIVIGQKVRIGDRVTILPGVTVGTSHILEHYSHENQPVIGDDVVLGTGSKILGGITIGNYAVIGANAVVISDIPPHSTAVGVPAKVLLREGGVLVK